MKKLLAPLLLLILTFEATGASGGMFFCRMLGERLTICCCPDAEEHSPSPMLAAARCCDVLEGAVPASSESLPSRLVADAPARSALAVDVALPAVNIELAPDESATHWGSASGPPRRIPVFLSLRQLLI